MATLSELRSSTQISITRQDAAEALGVTARTVSTGIAEGNIPSIKVGRRVIIPRERFLAMFDVPAGAKP